MHFEDLHFGDNPRRATGPVYMSEKDLAETLLERTQEKLALAEDMLAIFLELRAASDTLSFIARNTTELSTRTQALFAISRITNYSAEFNAKRAAARDVL